MRTLSQSKLPCFNGVAMGVFHQSWRNIKMIVNELRGLNTVCKTTLATLGLLNIKLNRRRRKKQLTNKRK